MHPTVRSLAKVAEGLGQSTTYIERLSARWKWVDRVGAWDAERDRERQLRMISHVEKTERQCLEIADTALERISAALKDIDPTELTPSHIARLLEVVLRVQQQIVGEPTEIRQPGRLMNATEIRIAIKAGLFSDLVEPQPPNPQLDAWLNGDLDSPDSPA